MITTIIIDLYISIYDIIKNKNLLNSSLWTYIEESDNKNKICKSLPGKYNYL